MSKELKSWMLVSRQFSSVLTKQWTQNKILLVVVMVLLQYYHHHLYSTIHHFLWIIQTKCFQTVKYLRYINVGAIPKQSSGDWKIALLNTKGNFEIGLWFSRFGYCSFFGYAHNKAVTYFNDIGKVSPWLRIQLRELCILYPRIILLHFLACTAEFGSLYRWWKFYSFNCHACHLAQ